MAASGHATIAAVIRSLLTAREPGASICPSEVARTLDPDAWRDRMSDVREVARALARETVVTITRGPDTLDPDAPFDGPIRLRRGVRWTSADHP